MEQTALLSTRCGAIPTGPHDVRILLGKRRGWGSGLVAQRPSDWVLPAQTRSSRGAGTQVSFLISPTAADEQGHSHRHQGVRSEKHRGHRSYFIPSFRYRKQLLQDDKNRKENPPSENTATLGTGSSGPLVDQWWVPTGTYVLRGRGSGDGPSSAHGQGAGKGVPSPAQSWLSLA